VDEETPGAVDALRALAHPVRWGILLRLAAEPGICACDFTEFFDVSQPTISAHLKVLREAGLVTTRRNGTTICYSIAPGQLARLGGELTRMAASGAVTVDGRPSAPGSP
jgi:ArsR family transcriptional regulator, arsenate/arsenite/antimonite-responsive transcriptional repressor